MGRLYNDLCLIIKAGDVQKLLQFKITDYPRTDHLSYDFYNPVHVAIDYIPIFGEQIAISLIEALVKLFGRWIINVSKYGPLFRAVNEGYAELFKRMVTLGADPKGRTEHGDTTLHKAIPSYFEKKAATPMIELVLSYGVNIDASNDHGETPLIVAVYCGRIDAVETLCRHGSKAVNTPNRSGLAPLYVAKNIEIIEMLVRYGANTFDVDYNSDYCYMGKELAALGSLPEKRRKYKVDDDYVTEIRYRIYFSRSLLERLFDNLIKQN